MGFARFTGAVLYLGISRLRRWIAVCAGIGSVLLAWLAFGRFHSRKEAVSYTAKPANLQKI